jgi:tetratricopeptide (TPR) repeat protein
MLRHGAFFEELGKLDECNPDWRSVSAGLVVMRLVDRWIEDGVVAADSWGATAVRESVAAIPDTTPLQRILASIVDRISDARRVDMRALSPRLMAYGQALEYDAKWHLAIDVYETIINHADPKEDADLLATAYIQLGSSLRNVGALGAASISYEKAHDVAVAAGDMIGVLRARIGDAKVAIARGNMPNAESILDDTIRRAEGEMFADVRSRALHDRATVAGLRGQYDQAIQFAYSALNLSTSQRERDRILADIATGFLSLGLFDVARDAYLVLIATAQDQYVRWTAGLNLMEIAGRQGAEPLFDRYRREFMGAELTPFLQVRYLITVGNGYRELGRPNAGILYLEQAVVLAATNEFNQLLFEAEAALAAAEKPVKRVPTTPWTPVPTEVEGIAEAIRDMRTLAAAGD